VELKRHSQEKGVSRKKNFIEKNYGVIIVKKKLIILNAETIMK
jgi:hypothetical protein